MSDSKRDHLGSDADILSARLAATSRVAPKSPSEALQPETAPPPPPRSQAVRHPLVVFLNFVLTLVVVGLVAGGAAFFVGRMQFDRPGHLDQPRTIAVERGAGLGAIAEQLQKNSAISSKWLFMAGVWLAREQNDLKAGEYLIPAHASMREIMDAMVEGQGDPLLDLDSGRPDHPADRRPDQGERHPRRRRHAEYRRRARSFPRPTSSLAATPATISSTGCSASATG